MTIYNKFTLISMALIIMISVSCNDLLDEPLQNEQLQEQVDYTQSENMILLLHGAYGEWDNLQWETFPIISVRGDDVNAAGDQFPLQETDFFRYERNFWMYNSTWLNLYNDVLLFNAAIDNIRLYIENGASEADGQQYIAEIKVLRAFELLQLARLWGDIIIPETAEPADLLDLPVSDFDAVMQHIVSEMDEAIPNLPSIRPNQRTNIEGGVTSFTAYAVKAMANLELKDYQGVADATDEIISSNLFTLMPSFYELFKIPGKLSDEMLLELRYSDFGNPSGTNTRYLWDFFGPPGAAWDPVNDDAGGGWGFWEPSSNYIKFMLERGEQERLITTVIFTPRGVDALLEDPEIDALPDFLNFTDDGKYVTPDGDIFDSHPRYKFLSGKFYLPTNQLTPGRTSYGENNNFKVIRYAEVLLMHAEALVSGASSSVMTADEAVNEVRSRAGMPDLSGVTLDDVLDEKFAEFATEWGIRFYDLVRHNRTEALNYGGRTYNEGEDRYLPYPLEQLDLLPQLSENEVE